LRAARSLLDSATLQDLGRLREARAHELDSWTQRVLDRAIIRVSTGGHGQTSSWEPPAQESFSAGVADIYAEALQVATKRVLHEVRPIVQAIDRAARDDIDTYDGSLTQAAMHRLASLLEALQSLGEAAEAPRLTEFDLTELVAAQLFHEGFGEEVVRLARTDPMLVKGDPALLTLALVNLVRNAIDASANSGFPVVVNWGRGGNEAWISVLDEGEGLPPDALSAAFDVGTTTRSDNGHFGLGLPIAAQAMSSLGGNVILRPRADVGTAAELRWKQ
jgi:signal transduction histidine kinase